MELQQIRIAIEHNEPLVDHGLRALLKVYGDLLICTKPSATLPLEVDVVVADFDSAIHILREPRVADSVRPRVVVLTANEKERDIRLALAAGVSGYQLMGCRPDELVASVRIAAGGRRYLCSRVAQRVAESLTHESLTSRELDVLRLVARGCANQAVATELDIGVGTVKTHVKSILSKLDARSRTHAAQLAHVRGLVPLEVLAA